MEPKTLTAEVRESRGKGPARQLRKQGLIPAIFYGPGVEPAKLQLSPKALARVVGGAYGRNQILSLEYGGEKKLALLKDLEVDPVTRDLLHADLYAISEDREVQTRVPFETKGRAIGVQKGARMRKLFRTLPVRALPQNVPASIVHDVAPLDMGAIVQVEDLVLPEGVEVTYPPNRRVLLIEAKERKKRTEEEEEAAEGAEGEVAPAAG
ncbi:MAG TPA: 50S ribosomal protein L25 [Sandaracinaceae bacterium LLY-WYZ-13_1]|nr:50S ribosomal protein L25 [Sandaracinaceae bacterium LLY-WYZ-13_1]